MQYMRRETEAKEKEEAAPLLSPTEEGLEGRALEPHSIVNGQLQVQIPASGEERGQEGGGTDSLDGKEEKEKGRQQQLTLEDAADGGVQSVSAEVTEKKASDVGSTSTTSPVQALPGIYNLFSIIVS